MEKLKIGFGSINELWWINSHSLTELTLIFFLEKKKKAYYSNTIPFLGLLSNLRGIYYSLIVKKNITG